MLSFLDASIIKITVSSLKVKNSYAQTLIHISFRSMQTLASWSLSKECQVAALLNPIN